LTTDTSADSIAESRDSATVPQNAPRVVRKRLADFAQNEKNPVKHNPRNLGMVLDSVRKVGAFRSGAASKGKILAGNLTWEAMAEAGIEDVLEVTTDGNTWVIVNREDLTPEQERYYSYADERSSELAEWDVEQLVADLGDGLDFEGVFREKELQAILEQAADDLLKGNAEPPEAQPDRAAELREQWQTERGQVWEIPSVTVKGKCHRLMCGDCTSAEDVARLWGADVPDAVVFDPPYDGDETLLSVRWQCRDALVFSNYRHLLDAIDGWPRFRCAFVWDGYTSWWYSGWPLARGRFCLWFGESEYNADGAHYGEPEKPRMVENTRGRSMYRPDPRGKHLSTIYGEAEPKQFDGHPHSKPVTWFRMLLANCTTGLIFDPYVGSGTTIIAAEQIGRLSIGLEIDPAAMAVTLERLVGLGLQPELATR